MTSPNTLFVPVAYKLSAHSEMPKPGASASEMHALRLEKGRVNHATYKMVYGQIEERIRRHARMNATEVYTKVPCHVPGRPVYKVSHAARYVVEKLRIAGFEAEAHPAEDGNVFVWASWKTAPKPAPKRPRPKMPPPPPRLVITHDDVTRRLDSLKARLASVS